MPADLIATRAIRAIRTIMAFGTLESEVDRYACVPFLVICRPSIVNEKLMRLL